MSAQLLYTRDGATLTAPAGDQDAVRPRGWPL